MRLHQGYAATPGLSTPTRTGDPARVALMRSAALRACIIRGAEPYRPNQRRSARHPYRSRTIAARCAALILRAPLLIRLRFASDPSGWRPRYHPLRFARIIRDAPRRAARDTRTASITPVPARRPELRIRRFNPRLPGGRRPHTEKPGPRARRPLARIVARAPTSIPAHTALRAKRFAPDSAQNAPETTRSPVRTRSRADASQKPYRARAVRWRVWWRAHRPAYQTAPHSAPSASRQKPPRSRMQQIAEAANRGSGKSRMQQIADPSEYNRKTNGKRNSVTTTKGFRNTQQIAY